MDYEIYAKLRKGNFKAFSYLCTQEIQRAWFICYHITQDVSSAAPLLIKRWKYAIEKVISSEYLPEESFRELLSIEIYNLSRGKLDQDKDQDFKSVEKPMVDKEYQPIVDGIDKLDFENRCVYLLNTFGGIGINKIAELLDKPFDEAKKWIMNLAPKSNFESQEQVKAIMLSTKFQNCDGEAFEDIDIPRIITSTMEHDYQLIIRNTGKSIAKPNNRKEPKSMKNTAQNKKTITKFIFKYKKLIIISAIVLVVLIAAIIFLPKIFGSRSTATSITTYNVEAITFGNVTSTVSGSGTLTPVTNKALTVSSPSEVEKLNFSVGDEVAKDDVVAVVKNNGDESVKMKAPCDGIIIEQSVAEGDSLDVGGTVSTIMGKDGFTMSIAVDELDISSIKMGQEVNFTIDAVDVEQTGSVTNISYNGTTSGSVTAYQIEATIDYVEGVYPGMSASAEIVIEDSGDGLLVPVDAVRTSGDDSYVYLAPSGAELGTEYEDGSINLNDLTKVTVETGMSDGSYIMIESDDLGEGDLIIIAKTTSTLTGSDTDNENSFGRGFGGFSGQAPGGMGSGGFGSGNFDRGNMPQGGGFPGSN